MIKKLILIQLMLFLFYCSSFSQTAHSGFSWLTTSATSNATSPNYNIGNCSNINYTINSSQSFKRTNNGAPYNNNCMIIPAIASNNATSINMTISFNQPISNLKVRFVDLDENNSGLPEPEESLTTFSPNPSSTTSIGIANAFYLVGNIVTPSDNNAPNHNNNTAGWINWNGNLSSISFSYIRPAGVNACLIIDSIYFDCAINCSLVADAGSDFSLCNSIPSTIDATNANATSYLWNTGATTSSINVSNAGTYWVDISNGICTDRDSVIVTSNVTPSVNLGNDTSACALQPIVLLSNSSSGVNYLWSNNATSNSITVNQTGNYWVQVSNVCGTDSDTINVTLEIPPTLNLGNDTSICTNSQLTLNPSISNATYLWQNNSSNTSFVVNQSGTYWVTVSTINCLVSDTINVGLITTPSVLLGNDISVCSTTNTSLTPTINGAYSTIIWNTGSNSISQSANSTGIYWVEVSNQCGFSRDSILVTIQNTPIVNLGNDTIICAGTQLVINPLISNVSYIWQDNSSNSNFVVTQAGNYWVTINSGACIVSDSIFIGINNSPTIDLGNDISVCDVTSTILSPTITGNYTNIVWNNNSNALTQIANTSGVYWVELSNICGLDRDSIQVNIDISPIVNLGNDTTICANSSLILNPNLLNVNYSWQNNSTQSTFTANQAGTYWVDIIKGSCTVRDSIIIQLQNAPTVNLGNDSTLCNGSSITLNATFPGSTYLWQNNSTAPTLSVNQAGQYWVNVTNQCGSASDTFNLSLQNPPQINFSNDTTFCLGETINLNASTPNASYIWQDNSINSYLTVSQAGIYSVTVNVGVCQLQHQFIINAKNCEANIEMPTVFTPNSDGINDYFLPVSYSKIKIVKILIVNRWGDLIYENANLVSGWDGTSNGKDCTEGVYFWRLEYDDFNFSHFTTHGFLHLYR